MRVRCRRSPRQWLLYLVILVFLYVMLRQFHSSDPAQQLAGRGAQNLAGDTDRQNNHGEPHDLEKRHIELGHEEVHKGGGDVVAMGQNDGGDVDAQTWRLREERYRKYQETEAGRTGPGEQGHPVKDRSDATLYEKEGMNIVASDAISLDRALPDMRSSQCRAVKYPSKLPTASVIIIYYNEAWSPILRTVHSVINRSPPQYLKEIILLDDYSTREELLEPLTKYIKTTWPDGIVRQVRTSKREGLIGARQVGAEAATGDVMIFLDAHCEATKGWLEPVLGRIQESRTAVICPVIGGISAETLSYRSSVGGHVGGFSWSGHFTWWARHHGIGERQDPTKPYSSPTMAGGLLAMDRKYFFELGGYDTGMEVWGGENLEMSFRIWQCGGTLEFAPCSHVGHIFRATHPYGFPDKERDYHGLNTARMAEVWMDEYKRLYYFHRPTLKNTNVGDLSSRHAIRTRLQCHDFGWFLRNVYPEKYIFDEQCTIWGQVRNEGTSQCIDTLNADEKGTFKLGLYPCHAIVQGNQMMSFSLKDEFRREERCADVSSIHEFVNMVPCHGIRGNQEWRYDQSTRHLLHVATNRCLDAGAPKDGEYTFIRVAECSDTDPKQRWTFSDVCRTKTE